MTRNFYNREPIPDPAEGTEGTGEDGAHFNGAEASGNTAVESTASDGGTAGETACLGDSPDSIDEDIGSEPVDKDQDGGEPGVPKE